MRWIAHVEQFLRHALDVRLILWTLAILLPFAFVSWLTNMGYYSFAPENDGTASKAAETPRKAAVVVATVLREELPMPTPLGYGRITSMPREVPDEEASGTIYGSPVVVPMYQAVPMYEPQF